MTYRTIQENFDVALQHHSAGRLEEAAALYRRILEGQPRSVNALHLFGVLSHQMGRHAEAVKLIGRALTLKPDFADAYNNLGTALRSKGDTHEAIAAYRRAIALKPDDAIAFNNLGGALKDAGQLDEAIVSFQRAVVLDHRFSAAHNNLGRAFNEGGEYTKAIAAYREAIAVQPDFAEAHSNLGNALSIDGQLDEAIGEFRQAIGLKPGFAEAYNNLGNALKDKGQIDEAIAAYRQAIALRPAFAEAYSNLGNALREQGQIEAAIAAYRKTMELAPGLVAAHVNLGDLYTEQGQIETACEAFKAAARCDPNNSVPHSRLAAALAALQRFDEAKAALDRAAALAPDSAFTHEARGFIQWRSGRGAEAIDSYRRGVEIAPGRAAGWLHLGEALRQNGRFVEAIQCAREALKRRPDDARAYLLMASLDGGADTTEISGLLSRFNDPRTSMGDRAAFGFVLGERLDRGNRFDEAFAHFSLANSLTLQMRNAAGARYSVDLFARQVDRTIARYTPAFMEETRNWRDRSETPVFIVGMARSGTSLIEQVASSHPSVLGAGELLDIGNIATGLPSDQWQTETIKAAAAKHAERLWSLSDGGALRVIDKMPENVAHLGLIATLFPCARVILCRRDPRDTCLSCYFQRFNSGNLFSFDLRHCGLHHVQTDRLIAHWLKVLPRRSMPFRILEVRYEDVVADLDGQSRRIIHFLDLPWDPACLDFHRTERMVQTASDWQVRQPIYTRSVDRWRNYEKHLAPLMEALGV
jgi:tetratricopeptide (TPR) repeat protein